MAAKVGDTYFPDLILLLECWGNIFPQLTHYSGGRVFRSSATHKAAIKHSLCPPQKNPIFKRLFKDKIIIVQYQWSTEQWEWKLGFTFRATSCISKMNPGLTLISIFKGSPVVKFKTVPVLKANIWNESQYVCLELKSTFKPSSTSPFIFSRAMDGKGLSSMVLKMYSKSTWSN